MRILITGANGFIGSNLIEELFKHLNFEVFAIGRHKYKTISKNFTEYICDLLDVDRLKSILEDIRPDVIIHLAANIRPDNSELYFSENIRYAANIYEVASNFSIPPFVINVGTAAQYGKAPRESGEVFESDRLKPISLYGISKKVQEDYFMRMVTQQQIRGCSVRVFNIIGNKMNNTLVPACFMHQIKNNKSDNHHLLTGDLSAIRDYIYISDLVQAFVSLLSKQHLAGGEIFNIASGIPVRIRDILSKCIELEPKYELKVCEQLITSPTSDVNIIYGNVEKFTKLAGWSPQVTWEQALEKMWLNYEI